MHVNYYLINLNQGLTSIGSTLPNESKKKISLGRSSISSNPIDIRFLG